MFWLFGCEAYGILASPQGTETVPSGMEGDVFNHQIAREIPEQLLWKTVWHIHFQKLHIRGKWNK